MGSGVSGPVPDAMRSWNPYRALLGRKKHKIGRKKQQGREPFHHMSSASAVLPLHV